MRETEAKSIQNREISSLITEFCEIMSRISNERESLKIIEAQAKHDYAIPSCAFRRVAMAAWKNKMDAASKEAEVIADLFDSLISASRCTVEIRDVEGLL